MRENAGGIICGGRLRLPRACRLGETELGDVVFRVSGAVLAFTRFGRCGPAGELRVGRSGQPPHSLAKAKLSLQRKRRGGIIRITHTRLALTETGNRRDSCPALVVIEFPFRIF